MFRYPFPTQTPSEGRRPLLHGSGAGLSLRPFVHSRIPGSRISARAVERAHSSIRMRGLARELLSIQAARGRLPPFCPFWPRTGAARRPIFTEILFKYYSVHFGIAALSIFAQSASIHGAREVLIYGHHFKQKKSTPRKGMLRVLLLNVYKRGHPRFIFLCDSPASSVHHCFPSFG